MKSRILTSIIGIPLLAIVFLLPPPVLLIAVSLICAVGTMELLSATHCSENRILLVSAVIFAACTPFLTLGSNRLPLFLAVFGFLLALIAIQLKYHATTSVEHIGFVFFVSMIFPFSFSCVAYLRIFSERDGLFYAILALLIPWSCDMGAYFAGTFFGRHKLCPGISPKKTVEGLVGGVIFSVIATSAFGWLYQSAFLKEAATLNFWLLVPLALVCALLSVPGDLLASLIKRQSHVKDFGSIMPGHGGVMDRFDSLLLVTPLLYLAVLYLPMIT